VVGAVLALLDRQRPLVQLAGRGRLPQLAPRAPEVVEGRGDLAVVGAVLALLDRQCPQAVAGSSSLAILGVASISRRLSHHDGLTRARWLIAWASSGAAARSRLWPVPSF